MSLLMPLALVGLLALPAIVLIHCLRARRRRQVVPAAFLWLGLSSVPSGRAQRRLPPLTAALLLQLAAAALMALALARPSAPAAAPRHLALVVDASASMQATDVAPSRFAVARGRALDRLAGLSDRDLASVVRAGSVATVVAHGPAAQARDALERLAPGAAASAMSDALALASAQVAATPGAIGQIVVFSDAAWPPFAPLGTLAAPLEIVTVGGGDDNRALVDLRVGTEPSGVRNAVYAGVANYADRPSDARLRLLGDDVVLAERTLSLPARGRVGLSAPLPAGVRRVTARLVDRDALALDDVAEATVPLTPPRNVELVSPAPEALRRALAAMPALHLTVADPTSEQPTGADLAVLDGVLPAALPAAALLLVNPPPDSPALLPHTPGNASPGWDSPEATHPLLQGIDLEALRAESSLPAGGPPWATTVLGSVDGPLVLAGNLGGRPTVVFAFDPRQSGLDKSLAFPLLVSNATSYLLSQQGSQAVRSGQPVTLPVPAGGQATLVRPDGSELPLTADAGADTVAFAATDQVGRYVLRSPASGAPPRSFTVSVLDALASDIRPRPLPALSAPAVAAAAVEPPVAEWWPWLAAGGFVVLLAEWLVFARRG